MQEFLERPQRLGHNKVVFLGPLTNNTTYKILKDYFQSKIGTQEEFEIFKSKNKGKNKNCFALIRVFSDLDYTRLLVTSHVILEKQARCKDFVQSSSNPGSSGEGMVSESSSDSLQKRVYFWNYEFQSSSYLTPPRIAEYLSARFGEVEEVQFVEMPSSFSLQIHSPLVTPSGCLVKKYGFATFRSRKSHELALGQQTVFASQTELELKSPQSFVNEVFLQYDITISQTDLSMSYQYHSPHQGSQIEPNNRFTPEVGNWNNQVNTH